MSDELQSLLRQLLTQSQENSRLLERILEELRGISQDVGKIALNTEEADGDSEFAP